MSAAILPAVTLGVNGWGYVIEEYGVPVAYASGFATEGQAQAAATEHERRREIEQVHP